MDDFSTLGIISAVVVFLIAIGIQIWYLWTLYQTMQAVPKKHHIFPA